MFNRHSIRIKGWDYSDNGWYFVTINTDRGKYLLGKIVEGKMILNEIGKIVENYFKQIPNHFENVELDVFQVMPNHVHGIIVINKPRISISSPVGVYNCKPLQNITNRKYFEKNLPNTIGSMIRAFKTVVKTWCNKNSYGYFKWQRNYYEHVIRNEIELYYLQTYIINNPLKWSLDKNNFESKVPLKKRGQW
jgi:putative transposase